MRPNQGGAERERGFALLIVLWALVLLALIVGHLTLTGRTELKIASNVVANAEAQAAADGAVYEAVFYLSDPDPERRWALDGSVRQLTVGDSRVELRVEDEAALINPSLASPVLIQALLQVTGSEPEAAARLAIAIGEWCGTVQRRSRDIEAAEYQAAGLDYGPPGAPLESLDELGRVLGMTPEVLAAIRPHLTLFGLAEPSPTTTDPVVIDAVTLARQIAGTAPPAAPGLFGLSLTARLTAIAAGPSNARARRTAIVRFGATGTPDYQVLAWESGAS